MIEMGPPVEREGLVLTPFTIAGTQFMQVALDGSPQTFFVEMTIEQAMAMPEFTLTPGTPVPDTPRLELMRAIAVTLLNERTS